MENSEYMSFDLTEPDRVTIRLQADVVQGISFLLRLCFIFIYM